MGVAVRILYRERGLCYASSGVVLDSVTVTESELGIRCLGAAGRRAPLRA